MYGTAYVLLMLSRLRQRAAHCEGDYRRGFLDAIGCVWSWYTDLEPRPETPAGCLTVDGIVVSRGQKDE